MDVRPRLHRIIIEETHRQEMVEPLFHHVPQNHLPGIAGADDQGPLPAPVIQPSFPQDFTKYPFGYPQPGNQKKRNDTICKDDPLGETAQRQIPRQEHGKHQHKSGGRRGDKDAQKIIEPDIPPGHLVDSEDKKRAEFHRHKERRDGKNEGVVPDVQVQIEMKEKGKKQRQVR